jgi:uncharacterized protein HemY
MRVTIWFVSSSPWPWWPRRPSARTTGCVVLLGRLAARRLAQPVPAGADRHLLPDRHRDPGAQLARRPAARAREWRVARRDRSGQAALRDALAQYFGGRYTRAQKSAQRALAIQVETPELAQDNEFTVLGHLLAAGSAHRLQNRALRDEELRQALAIAGRSPSARSAEEGARLLAAEWALDDRDAPRALQLLGELPPGVARRTHALRLKLQARASAARRRRR